MCRPMPAAKRWLGSTPRCRRRWSAFATALNPGSRFRPRHATGSGPSGMRDQRSARDRKSTRLNSSHSQISYAVFCLKKKKLPTYDIVGGDVLPKTEVKSSMRSFALGYNPDSTTNRKVLPDRRNHSFNTTAYAHHDPR